MSEATEIRRELLLVLSGEWQTTRDLAVAIGYSSYSYTTPTRDALYALVKEGRAELLPHNGFGGYSWRATPELKGGSSGE